MTYKVVSRAAPIRPPQYPLSRVSPWFLSPAVFLLAAAATFLLLFFRTGSVTASNPQSAPLLQGATLDMRVHADGAGLMLSWNRLSPAVQNARSAVLEIQDGGDRRQIAMDRSQIVSGSVFYRPASSDVSFRLSVREPRGADVAQMLRVLDAAPRAPAPEPARPETNAALAKPREAARKPAAAPPDRKDSAPVEIASALPVPTPPSTIATVPADDPVTKALQSSAPAPSPIAAQTSAPAVSRATGSAPAYVPPRPLKWMQPNIPMTEPLDIRVKVRIDESGRVVSAHALVDGPKHDRKVLTAVAAAIRQWTFEPAKAHGSNVPCEETIVIHLGPEAQ
ncbi:MAG: hypothetical protein JO340_06445 [Acidobacteriaceae bacterium]|nr:hypothetical protein [Acidobacteriaceae bacterium]